MLPILTAHCFKCHGLEAREAGLDLRTVGLMTKGGDSGPAIDLAHVEKSLLLEQISSRSMPPEKELPLSDEKIETIKRWLAAGAPAENPDAAALASAVSALPPGARDYWAFRRLQRPAPPAIAGAASLSPIDSFIVDKLTQRGLTMSRPAARQRLLRRLYYDLAGLLPEWPEVEQFVQDGSPEAFDVVVERLLNSPHFGERWARHWLDWCGYVDVIGDDTDREITKLSAGKWKYRDWVIRQLNADRPLDQFISEQLAGDELVDWRRALEFTPQMEALLVATGFLRTAPDETLQNELNTADIRHQVLAQTMEVVVGNLLGLTVNCARCHSHKYDPIPQEDYYRLLAFFTPAFNPAAWLQPAQRELADVSPTQKTAFEQANAELDKQTAELKSRLSQLREPYCEKLAAARLTMLPEAIRADTQAAIATSVDKRTEVQKYLADKFAAVLKVSDEEIAGALSAEDKARHKDLCDQIVATGVQRRAWGALQAVYDVGPPPPTYLLRRGNHQTPGEEVAPGFPRVLCDSDDEALAPCASPYEGASGRRLALAKWLTTPDTRASALVARVFVNRVWQELFGQGLVATSENLGASGTPPTHPELLEWLACEFVDGGWRLKPLIRLLLKSAVYQQESAHPAEANANALAAEATDPAGELLWRRRLRQLDSEALRDAILCASGKLNRELYGKSLELQNRPDGSVVVKREGLRAPEAEFRRSLYLVARRRYNLSLLEIFDQPEMARNCSRRTPSAVVTQSLTLLHDEFLQSQAEFFAARVEMELSHDETTPRRTREIETVFARALSRRPAGSETAAADELLRRQTERYATTGATPDEARHKALAHLCQMVLSSNEFLYSP